jgi:hypothetical protein
MDMFDGVGRRRNETEGTMFNLGSNSLNGNERDCLFRNNTDGTFTDVAYVDNADRPEDGRGMVVFDYDQDGRPDIVLRNYRQPAQLLHNVAPDFHASSSLIGTRSNRDAVGAASRCAAAAFAPRGVRSGVPSGSHSFNTSASATRPGSRRSRSVGRRAQSTLSTWLSINCSS